MAMLLILSLPWFYLLMTSAGFNDLMSFKYFSFDGGDVSQSMPAPPPGNAVLYGTIVQNGAPVAGIKLDGVLGGEFKVESLVTDADGQFSFSMTPARATLIA